MLSHDFRENPTYLEICEAGAELKRLAPMLNGYEKRNKVALLADNSITVFARSGIRIPVRMLIIINCLCRRRREKLHKILCRHSIYCDNFSMEPQAFRVDAEAAGVLSDTIYQKDEQIVLEAWGYVLLCYDNAD